MPRSLQGRRRGRSHGRPAGAEIIHGGSGEHGLDGAGARDRDPGRPDRPQDADPARRRPRTAGSMVGTAIRRGPRGRAPRNGPRPAARARRDPAVNRMDRVLPAGESDRRPDPAASSAVRCIARPPARAIRSATGPRTSPRAMAGASPSATSGSVVPAVAPRRTMSCPSIVAMAPIGARQPPPVERRNSRSASTAARVAVSSSCASQARVISSSARHWRARAPWPGADGATPSARTPPIRSARPSRSVRRPPGRAHRCRRRRVVAGACRRCHGEDDPEVGTDRPRSTPIRRGLSVPTRAPRGGRRGSRGTRPQRVPRIGTER